MPHWSPSVAILSVRVAQNRPAGGQNLPNTPKIAESSIQVLCSRRRLSLTHSTPKDMCQYTVWGCYRPSSGSPQPLQCNSGPPGPCLRNRAPKPESWPSHGRLACKVRGNACERAWALPMRTTIRGWATGGGWRPRYCPRMAPDRPRGTLKGPQGGQETTRMGAAPPLPAPTGPWGPRKNWALHGARGLPSLRRRRPPNARPRGDPVCFVNDVACGCG